MIKKSLNQQFHYQMLNKLNYNAHFMLNIVFPVFDVINRLPL
jgi:hypothetical protein